MADRYYVDWSDAPYPQIRPISDSAGYADPQTFTECKNEIIQRCRARIAHEREIIRQIQQLRKDDVK